MKKIIKIIILVVIGIVILVGVDGFSSKYFKTRPLLAKKEILYWIQERFNDSAGSIPLEGGIVYRTLFADVYYCDTTVDTYDEEYHMDREQKVLRYYLKKGEDFTCRSSISYYPNYDGLKEYMSSSNPSDKEYIKAYVKDLYNTLDGWYSVNKKLGVVIHNFQGYYVSQKYQDVYMFYVDDFSKDPVKFEIEGFDLAWRTMQYLSSPSGEFISFYYSCGYKEYMATGDNKYSLEDCENNKSSSGIYVFRVNGINDYEQVAFYSESRNMYLDDNDDSYFVMDSFLSDEEMIIKYTVTKNRQEEPIDKKLWKWNFINDTYEEYQDE